MGRIGNLLDAIVTVVLGLVAFLIVAAMIILPFILAGAGIAFGVWIVLKMLGLI